MNKVTYVSNAGVLLEVEGKKILIDSLCDSVMPIYKNTPEEIKAQILCGLPPFDNIDVMLVTHHHSDHFEPKGVVEFLQRNPTAIFVSTPETVKRLKSENSSLDESRLIAPDLQVNETERLDMNGIRIQVIAMIHEGKDFRDVENFAYLIDVNDNCILHPGDAKPMEENFNHPELVGRRISLLLAPFPYVGIPSGHAVIENQIKPQKIVAIHLPHKELDQFNWIRGTKKSYARVKDRFVETIFFEEIGESTDF
jgi:L-ascorbate metabolism protein UlaG (beta-lactamase superfamily)